MTDDTFDEMRGFKYYNMRGFKRYNGKLWPLRDKELLLVDDWVKDLEVALKHVKQRRVAFQAGGACGTWPAALAQKFDLVYTMEPDPLNFTCLCSNLNRDAEKVIRLQAAIGREHGLVDVNRTDYPENVGAQYVDPSLPGIVPMLRLDDLELQVLDFLALDVEGWEAAALEGGEETIRRCKPVVMIEAKPLKQMSKLGVRAETAGNLLLKWGYKRVDGVHRDVVYAPC